MQSIINFQKLDFMLSKPYTPLLLLGSITFTSLTTIQWALVFLAVAFVIDFATGILASWIEWKNSGEKIDVYLIESKKLRKSLSKAITYMAVIGFVYIFEMIFFIKSFKLSFSHADLTVTLIAVGVCLTVEFFSILENSKRSGYDIVEKIKVGAKTVWGIINNVKTGKDE